MAFKLNPPYRINPVSVHEVAFTPDNEKLGDGPEKALVAKANDNGTIIINKDIPRNSELYNNAISHEGQHLKDMMDNKLSYDENFVYENMDGKGAKKHGRESFSESDKNLPWEKVAYAAGDNKVQHDLRPKPEKLSGPPSMRDETPLAFKVMGSRHNEQRSPDKEKISMNEQFGMYAPAKKWGGPSAVSGEKDPPVSGLNKQSDAGGNDSSYDGAKVMYGYDNNEFTFLPLNSSLGHGQMGNKKIKDVTDIGGSLRDNKYLNKDYKFDEEMAKAGGGSNLAQQERYNRSFNNMINTVSKEKDDFTSSHSLYKDTDRKSFENVRVPQKNKGYVNLKLNPEWKWNDELSNLENMNSMSYTTDYYDKDGNFQKQGEMGYMKKPKASSGGKKSMKEPSLLSSEFRQNIYKNNQDYVKKRFLEENETLKSFKESHPNTFDYTKGNI